jgi:hypothetical protein
MSPCSRTKIIQTWMTISVTVAWRLITQAELAATKAKAKAKEHHKFLNPTPHCGNLAAPSLPHIFLPQPGREAALPEEYIKPPSIRLIPSPAHWSLFPSFSTPSSLRLHQSSRQPASTQLRLLRGGNRISFIPHSRFTLSPINFTAPWTLAS